MLYSYTHMATVGVKVLEYNDDRGYRGGSPTAIQAWQPCPLWEPSLVTPVLV